MWTTEEKNGKLLNNHVITNLFCFITRAIDK